MATTVTHVAGFTHIQVYDVVFDGNQAVINHSMHSDLLKVTIIALGIRSTSVPPVVFASSDQITLEQDDIEDDREFRVFIENVPTL